MNRKWVVIMIGIGVVGFVFFAFTIKTVSQHKAGVGDGSENIVQVSEKKYEVTHQDNQAKENKEKVIIPITSTIPILVYHSIAPKPDNAETKMQLHYRVTPDVFEKQMNYLQENGYRPIAFTTLVEHLLFGVSIPEKSVVITFDDGWKNQYTYAVPVLKKMNFPATFFIVTKSRSGGYMSWDDLKDLVNSGFEIGSHTETHAKLGGDITDQKLQQEVVGSKKELEEKLGVIITTIAYPYYSQSERARKAIADAGYWGARAGWASFKNSTDHVYELTSQEVVNNPNPFATVRISD